MIEEIANLDLIDYTPMLNPQPSPLEKKALIALWEKFKDSIPNNVRITTVRPDRSIGIMRNITDGMEPIFRDPCYYRTVRIGMKQKTIDDIQKILLDGGDFFEGSVAQFKDSFFSNPTLENIREFADENDCTLEFIWND